MLIASIPLSLKKGYHRYRCVYFLSWPTPRNRQWWAVKNETLRQRYDFNIPIVNFRYIRSTFPAAAYGVYICQMIRYSRTVAPIRMSLIEDVDNTEAIETMVPFGNDGVITSNMWRSPPWLGWQLWTICVNNNDHRYVPLIESTSQALPHWRLIIGW